MELKITGRQISVSEDQKEYANRKISKLEKYFNQVIDAHLVLSVKKLDHIAELNINGDGVQFHAKESSADLFSSIDLLSEKIEKQIVKYKDKLSSHKNITLNEYVSMDFPEETGSDIQLFQVSNKPIDKIEAYLQMKTENQDYILFKKGVSKIDSDVDYHNKNYGLIYKNGSSYRLLNIPFEKIVESSFSPESFEEFELKVIDDSPVDPKIEFNKLPSADVKIMTIPEAAEALDNRKESFIPFFNPETEYFNVIRKNGANYEVEVPAF